MPNLIDLTPEADDDAAPTGRFGIATAYNGRRAMRESGPLPADAAYVPCLLAVETVPALLGAFEEELGYAFDGERVVHSLGYSTACFPRLLAPLLVVELAKRVHSTRRESFVAAARDILDV